MTRATTSLKLAASAVALLFAASTAVNAQTTYYSTNFDSGTDTVNNNPQAANYNVYNPATAPVQPLDGVANWGSNDPNTTTGTVGTSSQLVGRSDYVGTVGTFFGGTNAGALGGIYRTPAGSALAPDVVPSTASGGLVTLYHAVSLTPTPTVYSLETDFVVTAPGTFATNRDTFAFTLGNATSNLLSINFTPGNVVAGNATNAIGYTVGGTTVTTASGIVLNAQYHLRVAINVGANTFDAFFTGATGNPFVVSGSLAGSAIAATAVNRAGALWNLLDKTATAGAYQNAGSGYLAFDNFSVVPEPSTYVILALGLIGLGVMLRQRRQQA